MLYIHILRLSFKWGTFSSLRSYESRKYQLDLTVALKGEHQMYVSSSQCRLGCGVFIHQYSQFQPGAINYVKTFLAFLFFSIEVQLMYNFVLVSVLQQSASVVHMCVYIFFHHSLLHNFEYNLLWHAGGPCCLSVLYIVICTC